MQPYIISPPQGNDPADEWVRLGVAAQVSGNLPLAQQHYNNALRVDPRHAIASLNLAIVFSQSNLLNEALITVERAHMFDGHHAIIPTNRALMALEADRIDEALEQAELAVRLAPKGKEGNPARMAYAMVLASAGRPSEAIPIYNEMLDCEPDHPTASTNACFVQTLTDASPIDLLLQRRKWYYANAFKGKTALHTNDRKTDRPLRIGYVSGDFKQHSASFIFSHVLLHHTSAVEMYLYSTLPVSRDTDARTKRFMVAAGWEDDIPFDHNWRDISTKTDEEAEKIIRADHIDILVDLAAHTAGGRLPLFTRKPAPVQCTAWGFAHGTGCPEIDYFLADPIAVPEEERCHYAEKIFDLPCIVTIEPPEDYNLKGESTPPYRKNGFFTFGTFARYEKMSEACLRAFAEIVKAVPDSRMIFKDHAYKRPYAIRRIQNVFEGVAPERLLFMQATSHPEHLQAYQQCDLALDPWPHGGGVVCLEQLYMGVPLLTLYGTQPSGRSGASVLTTMGKTGWVARSVEEYVERAVGLATDPKALMDARKTLRKELLESSVIKGYAEAVESAYKAMWQEWVSK